MADTTYKGVAALTIAKRVDGRQVYVYQGQLVPADVDPAEVMRLAAEGFIEPLEAPVEAAAAASTTSRGRSTKTPEEKAAEAEAKNAAAAEKKAAAEAAKAAAAAAVAEVPDGTAAE